MGQWTYGLMWGAPLPQLPSGETWYGEDDTGEDKPGLLEDCEKLATPPLLDTQSETVGCFFALGASARKHGKAYQSLKTPIDITVIASDERYADSLARAKASFVAFAELLAKRGIVIGDPKVWLVDVEVS